MPQGHINSLFRLIILRFWNAGTTVPSQITSCSLGRKSEITFSAKSFGKEDAAG
jgi:hypothetical protein